jgi:hypothetical protein
MTDSRGKVKKLAIRKRTQRSKGVGITYTAVVGAEGTKRLISNQQKSIQSAKERQRREAPVEPVLRGY